MKLNNQTVKITISILLLICLYAVLNQGFGFFDHGLEMALGGLGLFLQMALWLYLILQIRGSRAWLRPLRFTLLATYIICFGFGLCFWLYNLSEMIQGKPTEPYKSIQLLELKPQANGNTLVVAVQLVHTPIASDIYYIDLIIPVAGGLMYRTQHLWTGNELPTYRDIKLAETLTLTK